jgi:hypothetical protein
MGIVASLLGADNPLAQWTLANHGLLSNWGAGIAQGTNFGDALSNAARLGPAGQLIDQTYAKDQQEKADRAQAINMSAEALKKFPDLLQAVTSKAITPADAYSEMWKRMRPDYANGGSEETWGLTPQAYSVMGPDGKPSVQIGVMSNKGNFKPVGLPNGAQPVFPVQQLNTGTGFTGVDKFGNPTGDVTPIDNQGAALDTAVGKGFGETIIDARKAATDAQASLDSTRQARKLLDSGVITGFGADFKVGLGKALQQMGYHGADDAISNSEAYVATRAQEVGRLIKLFGAGTGLSDADREFATKAAAGSIELNEASIRRILDINERAAQNVLAAYNEMVTPIQSRGSLPNMTVGTPTGPSAGKTLTYNPATGELE